MGLFRLALALSVVLAHLLASRSGMVMVGGPLAVEAFFVISGFYMALVLNGKYMGALRLFYWNRFIRLYPTYWFVLAACIAFGFLVRAENKLLHIFTDLDSVSAQLLMLTANFTMFGSDVMMFVREVGGSLAFTADFSQYANPLHAYHYIPQAWSLPLELAFYLIAPWVVRRVPIIITLGMLSVVIKGLVLLHFGANDPWTYRFFPSELFLFMGGALGYHALPIIARLPRTRIIGTSLTATLAGVTILFPYLPGPLFVKAALFPVLVVATTPFLFELSRQSSWDRFVGEASYPLYISHLIVIAGATQLMGKVQGASVWLVLAACVATAFALHVCVGEPIEKAFKRKMSGNRAEAGAKLAVNPV